METRKLDLIAIVLLSIVGGATAVTADHHSITCNDSGYVLQPETRYRAIETIYLGKSCDAYSDAYDSSGRWCWTDSGVRVRYTIGQSFAMNVALPSCPQINREVKKCRCQ